MNDANLKLVETHEYHVLNCASCAIRFAIPDSYEKGRRRDHGSFYCPNGHSNHYPHENETERLKRELADTQRRLDAESERAATNYRLREKAERELKKVKKRTSGGACPCCNRSFVALGRHMKTKHPEFVEAQKNA